MDFWEGILLGHVWSDSDIRARSRRGILYVTSFVWILITALLAILPELQTFLLPGVALSFLLGALFHFAMPFAGAHYYRLPFYLRPLVLFGYVLGFFFFLKAITQWLLTLIQIDFATLPEQTLDFINNRIEEASRFLSAFLSGGFAATIVSIILGVLYVFAIFMFIGLGLFLAACLFIKLLVWIQRIWDRIISRYILKCHTA